MSDRKRRMQQVTAGVVQYWQNWKHTLFISRQNTNFMADVVENTGLKLQF